MRGAAVRLRLSHGLLAGFVISVFGYGCLVAYQTGIYPEARVPFWAGLWLAGCFAAAFLLGYIVVAMPQGRSRQCLKKKCLTNYLFRKRLLIRGILSGSIRGGRADLKTSPEEIERLMSVVEFRKTFGEGRAADEGFGAYSEYVLKNESEFRSVILQLSLIVRQLDTILDIADAANPDLQEVIAEVEEVLFSARLPYANAGEVKRAAGLLYSVFAGFSLTAGYRDYDPIEKAIQSL
jgi:hypothetical protein